MRQNLPHFFRFLSSLVRQPVNIMSYLIEFYSNKGTSVNGGYYDSDVMFDSGSISRERAHIRCYMNYLKRVKLLLFHFETFKKHAGENKCNGKEFLSWHAHCIYK